MAHVPDVGGAVADELALLGAVGQFDDPAVAGVLGLVEVDEAPPAGARIDSPFSPARTCRLDAASLVAGDLRRDEPGSLGLAQVSSWLFRLYRHSPAAAPVSIRCQPSAVASSSALSAVWATRPATLSAAPLAPWPSLAGLPALRCGARHGRPFPSAADRWSLLLADLLPCRPGTEESAGV